MDYRETFDKIVVVKYNDVLRTVQIIKIKRV